MKRLLIAMLLLAVLAVGSYALLRGADDAPGSAPQLAGAPDTADAAARGEYLARAADCEACHTMPGSGKRFAGGVAFRLPFGVIYSSNITAEPHTGIGRMSDDEFVRAVREGVRADGAHLYPAHPYTSYTQMSRGDVLAIKAYLFGQPAVQATVPANELAFPFNQRWAVGLWKAAFFKSRRFAEDPAKPAEWNRGAYLANALGHCGECHTPRNAAFAMRPGRALAGESLLGWRAYNITSDPKFGIGGWSDRDVIEYLRTGHADGHGSAAGPMGEAVEYGLQFLAPADAAALAAYLRTVPPQRDDGLIEVNAAPGPALTSTAVRPGADGEGYAQGLKLFAGACAGCHVWNGTGLESSYASLLGSRSVNDTSGANAVQAILHGVDLSIGGSRVSMPAFAADFSNAEIAALANFVISHFGGKQGRVTAEDVARQRPAR